MEISLNELSKMKFLGGGACSQVYYDTKSKKAIKLFKPSGTVAHDEEQFSNLLGLKNSTCVFPQDRVNISGSFKGYAMEYVQGIGITDAVDEIEIDTLIAAIASAEDDFRELAQNHIIATDMNAGEIMWSEEQKRLKVVDTDFFVKNEEVPFDQCYKKSISQFYTILELSLGIMPAQKPKLFEHLNKDKDYSQLYKDYITGNMNGNMVSITELIRKMVEILKRDFKRPIRTWGDMQETIKKNFGLEEIESSEIPIFTPPGTNSEECSISPFETWVTAGGTLKGIKTDTPQVFKDAGPKTIGLSPKENIEK